MKRLSRTSLLRLRSSTPFLVVFVPLFLLTACERGEDITGSRPIEHLVSAEFSYQEAVTDPAVFRLVGINGSIEIVGVPGLDTLKVWGTREVGSYTPEDAAAHLDLLEIRFSRFISSLLVETLQPSTTDGRSYKADYHCLVPSDWEIQVVNVNGGISVTGCEAGVTVEDTNGELVLEEVSGQVTAVLVNGVILLTAVEGEGELAVTNGSISGQLVLTAGGTLRAITINGTITLAVPDTVGAELDATAVNGSISVTGLPLTITSSSLTSLRGTIGDGSGQIVLVTVNGTITLTGY